jgi:hypothetical protein
MTDLHAEGLRIAEALQAAQTIADPIERYQALDAIPEQMTALVAAVRIAQGKALAELKSGLSWGALAEQFGVRNYQYAQKLVNAAQAAQREEWQ